MSSSTGPGLRRIRGLVDEQEEGHYGWSLVRKADQDQVQEEGEIKTWKPLKPL